MNSSLALSAWHGPYFCSGYPCEDEEQLTARSEYPVLKGITDLIKESRSHASQWLICHLHISHNAVCVPLKFSNLSIVFSIVLAIVVQIVILSIVSKILGRCLTSLNFAPQQHCPYPQQFFMQPQQSPWPSMGVHSMSPQPVSAGILVKTQSLTSDCYVSSFLTSFTTFQLLEKFYRRG